MRASASLFGIVTARARTRDGFSHALDTKIVTTVQRIDTAVR